METGTTPVGCVGIVLFPKCPAKHMADTEMLEEDLEVSVYLKDKLVDCFRVDGASKKAHVM